jgi:hypothetical protein
MHRLERGQLSRIKGFVWSQVVTLLVWVGGVAANALLMSIQAGNLPRRRMQGVPQPGCDPVPLLRLCLAAPDTARFDGVAPFSSPDIRRWEVWVKARDN